MSTMKRSSDPRDLALALGVALAEFTARHMVRGLNFPPLEEPVSFPHEDAPEGGEAELRDEYGFDSRHRGSGQREGIAKLLQNDTDA